MPAQPKTSAPGFRGLRLVAGHPALDLVNSVKYRGQADPQDRLVDYPAVVAWARVAGILDAAEEAALTRLDGGDGGSDGGGDVWQKVLVLRESLWALLNREQVSKAAASRAQKAIETAISGLRYKAVIDPESGVLRQVIELRAPKDLLARIAGSIADLLTRRQDLLIKTCDGCDCDWLFIDRTKARRRRWCDTRTCGNLARVRSFREKRQTTAQDHAG